MRPGQRLLQLLAGVTVAIAALSACRREVPPPPTPTPIPDRDPAPSVHFARLGA